MTGAPADPAGRGAPGTRLRRASALTGLDVVTLGGDRAVEVKDVVFDKGAGRLTGFTLRKPGLLGGPQKRVLPVEAVHSVGDDAVMIESHAELVPPEALAASGDNVIGDRVITDDGTELGTVDDVIVSVHGGSADILAFQVKADGGVVFVPLPAATAISGEAVVVPARVRDHLVSELDDLPAAVARLRDHGDDT